MPEAQTYSDFFQWLIVRKASSTSEVRDWYAEYSAFVNQIDADLKLNRIKAVFQSDTTPETLVETNSNSIIFNGSVLATQVYNLPEIDSANIGMVFRVMSDSASNTITMLRTGSDVIHVNGVYHGTAFNVSNDAIEIVARELGVWEIPPSIPSHAETHDYNGSDPLGLDGLQFVPKAAGTAPSQNEGLVFYDQRSNALSTYNDLADVTHALGREILVRCTNSSGGPISNGQVVYVTGADVTTHNPTIALADADSYDKSTVLAIATMDIANGADGDVTAFGQVNGIDTTSISLGLLFLGTTPGAVTNTRPMFPAKAVIVGYCVEVNATTGAILTAITNDTYDYEFDGTCPQRQDCFIVESGGTVYAEAELNGGGDLPVQIEGDVHLLDCTTGGGVGGRARVALTAGTDIDPQENWIYIELSGGTPVLTSSTSEPTGTFAMVSTATIWTAAKTATDGPAKHQRWTDAVEHDGRGRIPHIDMKLRDLGTNWKSGVDPTITITPNVGTPDNVLGTFLSGVIRQIHRQSFPSMSIVTDGIYVANAGGAGLLTKFEKINNLNLAFETTSGVSLSGSRFNLVLGGLINKTATECKLFVNLPTDNYSTDAAAYADTSQTAITSIDTDLYSVAFLICRIPLRHTTVSGGTWTFINPVGASEIIDLRGQQVNTSASGTSTTGGAAILNELGDVSLTTPDIDFGGYLAFDGTGIRTNRANNYERSRHVTAATDTILITDKNIFVDYTATGPVIVTIPDAFLLLDSFTVDIIDSGENATTNNITIQDGSGNIIAVMRTSKMALTIVTDGTNARVK